MSGFDGFIGSEKLISRLKRDIAAGRLSHALIIEGAPGTGKRTLARLICAAVSCREADRPCMSCINCSKILRDQSPDVIFITPIRIVSSWAWMSSAVFARTRYSPQAISPRNSISFPTQTP